MFQTLIIIIFSGFKKIIVNFIDEYQKSFFFPDACSSKAVVLQQIELTLSNLLSYKKSVDMFHSYVSTLFPQSVGIDEFGIIIC